MDDKQENLKNYSDDLYPENINKKEIKYFQEMIRDIKEIVVPDIKIDKNMIMKEILKEKTEHNIWRYLIPVIVSYFITSTFYFVYYFREVISNIFLYFMESKLKWFSEFLIKVIKIILHFPKVFFIFIIIIPIASLSVISIFKLTKLFNNSHRRKYEKIF